MLIEICFTSKSNTNFVFIDEPQLHSLNLVKCQAITKVPGIEYVYSQVAGLNNKVKPLLDDVSVEL